MCQWLFLFLLFDLTVESTKLFFRTKSSFCFISSVGTLSKSLSFFIGSFSKCLLGESAATSAVNKIAPSGVSGHSKFLNDVSVTLIDKTDPRDPTKREDYWILILKTKKIFKKYCILLQ